MSWDLGFWGLGFRCLWLRTLSVFVFKGLGLRASIPLSPTPRRFGPFGLTVLGFKDIYLQAS